MATVRTKHQPVSVVVLLGHVVGKPLDSVQTLYEKRLFKKLMPISNDPTHIMRL